MLPWIRRIGLELIVLLLSFVSSPLSAVTRQTVVVRGPTIIAFFTPATQADLQKDPDTNEALADFQVYARRSRKRFPESGIAFHEIYALSFRVKIRAETTTFTAGKTHVGYYFVAPGKRPRVEYGVMSDDDIAQIARAYFNIVVQ